MSDLQHARIAELCEELRLKTTAATWPAAAQAAAAKGGSFGDVLEQVLRMEVEARRVRAREMAARVAGFPAIKTLEAFDFAFATGVPRQQVQELASLAFVERGPRTWSCSARPAWARPTSRSRWATSPRSGA